MNGIDLANHFTPVPVLTHNIPKSDEQHLSRVTEKNFVAKYQ
jgi:hypothetical protein